MRIGGLAGKLMFNVFRQEEILWGSLDDHLWGL
jgi:hypothetical protein